MGSRDPARPTHVRYLVLGSACALGLIAYVTRVGFASVLLDLSGPLHLEADQKGYLMAAFLLAYGGFEVPWGVAGDRLGARHLLPLVAVSWSLLSGAVTLTLLLPPIWGLPLLTLLALRFLFGLFQAGLFPPLSRVMADWMPVKERATAQGAIWMSSRAGGFLASHVFALLAFYLGGWPAAWWALSGLGVLWALAFWPWFRNRPEEMPAVNAAEREVIAAGRAAPPAGHAVPWGRMLRSRSVWALCLMYGFGGFAANFFVTLLPTYLSDYRHLDKDQIKWLSSLPLACGIVGCLLGGVVSDLIVRTTGNRRWGRVLTGVVGASCAGVAVVSTVWVEDVTLLAVLLCTTFFCNDLAMGPAWAAVADIGERHAGTLGGKMNMVGNVGGAVAMLITGYLFKAGRPELVFAVYACSFGLASLCWLFVDVTRPVAAEP